jgi:hypothetical protein
VAIRVHISSSASNLTFDEQHFATAVDGIQWQTPNYQGSTQRYYVSVSGSVSNMILASGAKKG